MNARVWVPACWISLLLTSAAQPEQAFAEVVKYARFRAGDMVAFGIVEGDRIRQLEGNLFRNWKKTEQTYALNDVKLLPPSRPAHVFSMAGNYKSHLGGEQISVVTTTETTVTFDATTGNTQTQSETTETIHRPGEIPPQFRIPQPFLKTVSSLTGHDAPIVLPADAGDVHYEAELVVVIGKRAKDVKPADALDYVLGVTCGNDVSARAWQRDDVQWWRAKGSDTFSPCGPYIVSGLNYDDLEMRLRLNGEVRQETNTSQLIHGVAATVSFISRHVTLLPGDLIFTGTPGTTSTLQAGDVVEVELEGVGVLRNRVVAE